MNILVLAGGLSPERDVSLSSGALISNALVGRGHRVLLVDLFKGLDADGAPILDRPLESSEYFFAPSGE